MRGSPRSEVGYGGADGIIPAGAGLTRAGGIFPVRQWDHPRGCGAHLDGNPRSCVRKGSSPRVRGSLKSHRLYHFIYGIIPAGAGLTLLSQPPCRRLWDHPRGCGAHNGQPQRRQQLLGSSPRVRGSPTGLSHTSVASGIIPAGAGLTADKAPTCPKKRDHPRGCGAHKKTSQSTSPFRGSSPRVRGSHRRFDVLRYPVGIIPAGAGLTSCALPR